MELRIGQGIDVHPFEKGRALRLGGVDIPSDVGLKGHSDADAVLHALIDALLGASGRPDIGCIFPDTDNTWKNADSRKLLALVWKELRADGWSLVNADLTLLAEQPKIKPYTTAMRETIAGVLDTTADRIGIKATTTEKLGFIGRKEGLLASAVVLLKRES
jgi:2-C-methyl-D-erythritol 2,4-cyclodiphosphate synthase